LYVDKEFLNDFNSMATRRTYSQILNYFFDFVMENFKDVREFGDVDRGMVIDYKNFISETGGRNGQQMAPKTIRKHLATISSYYNFLAVKGIVDSNPASTVKRPRKVVIRPTNALTLEQTKDLFLGIESKESGPLHLALISTLWLTGLRKSEVLNLKRKDYYKRNDEVIIQFKGKGGKFGEKHIHPRLEAILDDYLDWMKEKGREHGSEDWLFQPTKNPSSPTHVDKPINPRTLNRIIKKYSDKIGLNFSVSSHSARASFIGVLLDEGVPILEVSKEVKHASVNTTQEYDKRRKSLKDTLIKKLPF
jgi:integrase